MRRVKGIKVSEETWRKLQLLRIKLNAKTMDEVVKYLIESSHIDFDTVVRESEGVSSGE